MLTPSQLKAHKFNKSEDGNYSADEVNLFLGEVIASYNQMFRENGELIRKITVLANKVEDYRRDENNIRDALLNAQRAADNVMKQAETDAAEIIEAAHVETENIVSGRDGIITKAEAAAADIVEKARLEAENTVEEARQSADSIFEEARRQGEESASDTILKATEEAEKILEQASAQLEEAKKQADEILSAARAEAIGITSAARSEAAEMIAAAKVETAEAISAAKSEAESILRDTTTRLAAAFQSTAAAEKEAPPFVFDGDIITEGEKRPDEAEPEAAGAEDEPEEPGTDAAFAPHVEVLEEELFSLDDVHVCEDETDELSLEDEPEEEEEAEPEEALREAFDEDPDFSDFSYEAYDGDEMEDSSCEAYDGDETEDSSYETYGGDETEDFSYEEDGGSWEEEPQSDLEAFAQSKSDEPFKIQFEDDDEFLSFDELADVSSEISEKVNKIVLGRSGGKGYNDDESGFSVDFTVFERDAEREKANTGAFSKNRHKNREEEDEYNEDDDNFSFKSLFSKKKK